MQNRLTDVLMPAALLLSMVPSAMADSTEARCDIYPAGAERTSASIACTFAQYQGNVYIDRSDGVSHQLRPSGEAVGNFVDQSGNAVYRQAGLGSAALIFRMPAESVFVYWDASSLQQAAAADGKPSVPVVAQVLGTEIHSADAEELKYLILSGPLDRHAAEHGIEVSQAEINEYLQAMQRVAEQDRRRRAERREQLVRQLASASPGDAGRDALESKLQALDQLEANLGEVDSSSSEERAAREQVAAAFIRQCKINRALYRQYGGRIVFQQGGPEPLDAYRAFLEAQQKQGDFRTLDKSFETEFWRYYLGDNIHSFYPAGGQQEAQAFATPWWLPESPPQAR